MKRKHFSSNMMLLRAIWNMSRKQLGELLDCTEKQIGSYERGDINIPAEVLLDLEEKTSIPAYRLYYEQLSRASFPIQPLSQADILATTNRETRPPDSLEMFHQYHTENLSLSERVKRLEMKVFGA